jgi:hypothetical protein
MAYIAGPVIRQGTPLHPWVRQCYSIIEDAAGFTQQRATIPYGELRLERATPREFSAQILGRIRDARSVIAVFLPNDPSTPIECAFAVQEGKRVLIIHQEGVRVPRLLAGLPGVTTLAFEEFGQRRLLEQISTFLEHR